MKTWGDLFAVVFFLFVSFVIVMFVLYGITER